MESLNGIDLELVGQVKASLDPLACYALADLLEGRGETDLARAYRWMGVNRKRPVWVEDTDQLNGGKYRKWLWLDDSVNTDRRGDWLQGLMVDHPQSCLPIEFLPASRYWSFDAWEGAVNWLATRLRCFKDILGDL